MTNKTNHRAITIDQLPIPQSRAERYCDFLVGRSSDLATLPVPQSRIEEFLEYLCYNNGIGGGAKDAFNSIVQDVDAIKFESNGVEKARIEVVSEQEIIDIVQQLN